MIVVSPSEHLSFARGHPGDKWAFSVGADSLIEVAEQGGVGIGPVTVEIERDMESNGISPVNRTVSPPLCDSRATLQRIFTVVHPARPPARSRGSPRPRSRTTATGGEIGSGLKVGIGFRRERRR